jgi:hypothetical protein
MNSRNVIAGVAFVIVAAIIGCAPTHAPQQNTTLTQVPRPDAILVYDFAVSPDEVTRDKGLSAELIQEYEHYKGTSRTAEEIQQGHKVADAVADELVKKIRSYGLWADRSFGQPSGTGKVLMVKGQFLSVDEGNRSKPAAIGLDAGRTDVQAHVQVYELTLQAMEQGAVLQGTANSSDKPGTTERIEAGAAPGRLLTSTVVSGVVAGGAEMTSARVEADGKRLADKIALDLGNYFVSQAWIAPDALKKSFF